ELVADVVERRSFQVAVHLERFEEPARVAQRLEFLATHEVVVDTFTLAGARRARRPRHRPVKIGIRRAQSRPDRALSRSGRAGENEQDPARVGVVAAKATGCVAVSRQTSRATRAAGWPRDPADGGSRRSRAPT